MGDDMFARGVHDAENDDLNPFYYQHYYHYRRGFDMVRRRRLGLLASPLLWGSLLAMAVLAITAAVGLTVLRARPVPTSVAVTFTSPPPTASPSPPVATAPPSPTPHASPALQVGAGAVVINTGGQPLRLRRDPGLSAPIEFRIAEGTRVTLVDGPVEADGLVWWYVQSPGGTGWAAARTPEGTALLEATP